MSDYKATNSTQKRVACASRQYRDGSGNRGPLEAGFLEIRPTGAIWRQRPAKWGRNKQALRLRSPRASRQMALVFGLDSRFDKFVAALPFQVLNCFTGDRGDYPRRPSTTVFSCLRQPHTKQAVRSQLDIFSRQICRRPFVVHPPPTLLFAPWFERKPPKVKPQLCGVPPILPQPQTAAETVMMKTQGAGVGVGNQNASGVGCRGWGWEANHRGWQAKHV